MRHSDRRWQRYLTLAMAGVLASFAIALCAAYMDRERYWLGITWNYDSKSGIVWHDTSNKFEWSAVLVRPVDAVPRSTIRLASVDGVREFSSEQATKILARKRLPIWSQECLMWSGAPSSPGRAGYKRLVGWGWPLPCMYAILGSNSSSEYVAYTGTLADDFDYNGASPDGMVLPGGVLVSGLVTNCMAFTGTGWCLMLVHRRVRQLYRLRLGQCPACGYEKGMTFCPECGHEAGGPKDRP